MALRSSVVILSGLAALVMLAVGATDRKMVGPTGEPQAVDASMFVGGGMNAPGVDVSITVNGPVADVYKRFTTAEGWKKSFEVEACIDLRIGGCWEIYFNSETKIGSNGCQVLSYIPDEMISFSWNAPPKFEAERGKRTWVVVTFAKDGEEKTKVRLRHFGFTSEGKWPEVKTYFGNAWPNVLKALAESYDKK